MSTTYSNDTLASFSISEQMAPRINEFIEMYNRQRDSLGEPPSTMYLFCTLQCIYGESRAEEILDSLGDQRARSDRFYSSWAFYHSLESVISAIPRSVAVASADSLEKDMVLILVKYGVLPKSYAQRLDAKDRDGLFASDLGL